MDKVRLGRSELWVAPIAFGTWELSGYWGDTDDKSASAAVHRALELGVNLFDSAQAYGFGVAEEFLARALRGTARDEVVIATKGGIREEGSGIARDSSPRIIRQGIESSLRALETDYIDLYQIHWPDPKTPFEETGEVLRVDARLWEDSPRGRLQFYTGSDAGVQQHTSGRDPAAAVPHVPTRHRERDPPLRNGP